MRTDKEINFLIERIEVRLNSEALQKPINKTIKDAYQKAIEMLRAKENDPFRAGLNYKDLNQHSFTIRILNQVSGYFYGDVPARCVLFNLYPDGFIDKMEDIPEEVTPVLDTPLINTMTFNDFFYEFDNPVYALRYCLADGSSPFISGCPWDLTAKSVSATDAGIFATTLDLKKIINPDGTIREDYICGVMNTFKIDVNNAILLLLESDPKYLIESNPYNNLGEPEDSKVFRQAVIDNKLFIDRCYREFETLIPNTINKDIIEAQTKAHREISFSRANIIHIAKYGETYKLLRAAILYNQNKGRGPLTGLNYVPGLKQINSWLQNKVEEKNR